MQGLCWYRICWLMTVQIVVCCHKEETSLKLFHSATSKLWISGYTHHTCGTRRPEVQISGNPCSVSSLVVVAFLLAILTALVTPGQLAWVQIPTNNSNVLSPSASYSMGPLACQDKQVLIVHGWLSISKANSELHNNLRKISTISHLSSWLFHLLWWARTATATSVHFSFLHKKDETQNLLMWRFGGGAWGMRTIIAMVCRWM